MFTKGICDRLESAILPSESNNNKNAITAFGMFIGYSLSNVDKKDLSASEYQDKVYDHLKMDIMNNSQYIEELINRHNLQGYPIYIYLLPFTDADTDKKNLMNRLLQISGRTL